MKTRTLEIHAKMGGLIRSTQICHDQKLMVMFDYRDGTFQASVFDFEDAQKPKITALAYIDDLPSLDACQEWATRIVESNPCEYRFSVPLFKQLGIERSRWHEKAQAWVNGAIS